MQLVVCQNHSTILTDLEFRRAVYACAYHVKFHLNRSPWCNYMQGEVRALPLGQKPPVDAYNLIFLDSKEEQGVLGFHEDEAGTNIPFSDVSVYEAKVFGESVSSVA